MPMILQGHLVVDMNKHTDVGKHHVIKSLIRSKNTTAFILTLYIYNYIHIFIPGSYLSVSTHHHLFPSEHDVSGPLQPEDQQQCYTAVHRQHNGVTLQYTVNTTVLHCSTPSTQQCYTVVHRQHNSVTL